MKIGFDAKRAFLNASGLGNFSRNTLEALQKYSPGNEYVLFTPEIKKDLFPQYKEFDIVSPESTAAKLFKSLWRSFSVSSRLKHHEIDLFHGLSNELPEGIHKNGVPSLVTIHDLIFMRFPVFYKSIDRKIYYRKVKYACTAATRIMAISEQTKYDITRYLHIDPEKIDVVYQSVSPHYFQKSEWDYLTEKYNLPGKYILAVGTIEQRKNQLSLLHAIKEHKLDVSVVFVGKPTLYSESLLKYITKNKMEERVKFLANIPGHDLAGLYQGALLSVYISLFEGFGLPVIESMACSCPVVTSKVSCLPETAGDAALLCDPSDISDIAEKIQLLLSDESLKKSIIDKGRDRAMLFHPEHYSRELISLYSKTINRQ